MYPSVISNVLWVVCICKGRHQLIHESSSRVKHKHGKMKGMKQEVERLGWIVVTWIRWKGYVRLKHTESLTFVQDGRLIRATKEYFEFLTQEQRSHLLFASLNLTKQMSFCQMFSHIKVGEKNRIFSIVWHEKFKTAGHGTGHHHNHYVWMTPKW